ncbi:MAG: AAA family ATPase [Pseudomarimonas sp.]
MPRPLNASVIGSPFLDHVGLHADRVDDGQYPFTIRSIMRGLPLRFSTPVTFLVGENGSGKSTLLEALAWALGFSDQGGDRSNAYAEGADGHALGRALALRWRKRVSGGFFLRAETFFNYARHLEELGSSFSLYDGIPLNQRSHGEAFLALFQNRFEDGTYLLDEPEAALSPSRQLAFLSVLHDLSRSRAAQLIIATHSPILLTLPGARVLRCDDAGINEVDYRDTEHFQLTRDFLNAPERYFRHLFDGGGED